MDNHLVKSSMLYFGPFCIVIGVFSCLIGNVAGGGVIIITGLALILLGQFQLESIKLLGLEAKLRGTIYEAESVLEKLKKISLPVSQIALATAAKSGRVDGATSSKDMMLYVTTIEEQLLGMGVTNAEIEVIKQPWIKTASFDLSSLLDKKFINYYDSLSDRESEKISTMIEVDSETKRAKEESLDRIRKISAEKELACLLLRYDDVLNYIQLLKDFIKKSQILSDCQKREFIEDNKECIDDIIHLIDKGCIRRPNHPDSFPIND